MADNKYAGTQTEKNLQEAFAGESQARNKYTYFASVAQKEGYEQMSALFLKTADNEKEHMEMLKAFIHIKVTEQHKYNSNIGCVLIYLQGGTTNEIRM